jgi:hypothetical protein
MADRDKWPLHERLAHVRRGGDEPHAFALCPCKGRQAGHPHREPDRNEHCSVCTARPPYVAHDADLR